MIRPYHDNYILAQSAYNIKDSFWESLGERLTAAKAARVAFPPPFEKGGYQAPAHLAYVLTS